MTRSEKRRLRRYNVVNEPDILMSPKVKFGSYTRIVGAAGPLKNHYVTIYACT